jgi:hypothetical protein
VSKIWRGGGLKIKKLSGARSQKGERVWDQELRRKNYKLKKRQL